MTSASSMYEAGHPKSVLWDNLEGWGGERGVIRVQNGETHVYLWLIQGHILQKLSQYHKIIILQLK